MIIAQLPFADIVQNFQDIGEKTGFNGIQFLAQSVAVIILFLFLQKFAWAPVRTMLDERRKIIADSLTNADKIKKELADAESTRLGIIQKANEKANLIIAEAEKSALAVTEQRLKEATRQAEDIIKNAHEAAVLDRNRLMAELKSQIGALVIQTTEKVAGKVLTPDDQARLNSETLRQLEATRN
jgi:F-type H+-transporting ATPase subunit b